MGTGRDAPSGDVTFVLTDIEGSTKLARALGDTYADLIGRHHELLRSVWDAHHGYEISTEGDAFIVAFGDVTDAVVAAVEAQRAVAAEAWPGGRPVRIRIGVHRGYARPVDGDYRALSLNQAARVVGCAHGGQTFATDDVVTQLAERPAGITVTPLGRYRVRDFDGPVALHAVGAPDLAVNESAPRVRPADGHNVVPPATALLGREADVTAVVGRLRPRGVVTIAGPGGVGKTRLAMEVAVQVAAEWPDGVWFVDLAPVTEAHDVPLAVAQAVGAPIAGGEDVWHEVLAHLEQRHLLVLLDNCEHVLAGVAALVRDLLGRCPRVGVLATSRAPLDLIEEQVHRLGTLPVHSVVDAGVQLFLQRAAEEAGRLAEDDVVALCAELDGLPLAIELAAARTTAISPGDILARLRAAPGVLRSRDPGLPERHRSLERSLAWSDELLDPVARCVFHRLSVFASSFDLAAAERVAAADDIAADDVAEVVWSLVDASLLQTDATAGATRYRMLSVVRTHTRSVADPTDAAAAMRRLARLELERVGPERPIDREWHGAMAAELDNVRHVVAQLAASRDADEVAVAQTLVWSIGRHHDGNDAFRAGIDEVDRWVAVLTTPTPERAALLALLAELHLRLAKVGPAERLLDAAAKLADVVGGLPMWDDTSLDRGRGELALRRGDLPGAIEIARSALTTPRSPRGRVRLLNLLGIATAESGDAVAAADVFRAEVDQAERAGMESYLVTAYGNLAEALLRSGDAPQAAARQLDCLELSRQLGGTTQLAFALIVAAHLAATEARWEQAVVLHTAADVELARVECALYGADLDRRHELLDAARRALGDAAFDAAVTAGRSLGIHDGAETAAAELRRVAARQEATT